MTTHYFLSISLASLVLTSAACSNSPETAAQASTSTPAPAAATLPAAAPSHEPSPAASPAAQAAGEVVTGPVLETMDASTYTYVKVKGEKGEIWAASSHFDVKVGDRVTVPLESPMENFHSQSLNRDFPLIYFASHISREGEAPAGAAAQMPPGHPPASSGTAVTEKIAAPEGGKAIASVWAERKALAGKPVTVRGKVVKFNGGIMGRNWVHLQDGSGKAEDKSNDLTVTTDDQVSVGDVVTVTGTLVIDKDFGAGYSYAVLLENGKIKR